MIDPFDPLAAAITGIEATFDRLLASQSQLRASHAQLLAAAKRVQRISHAPFPPDGNAFDAFEALDAAIASAEELAQ